MPTYDKMNPYMINKLEEAADYKTLHSICLRIGKAQWEAIDKREDVERHYREKDALAALINENKGNNTVLDALDFAFDAKMRRIKELEHQVSSARNLMQAQLQELHRFGVSRDALVFMLQMFEQMWMEDDGAYLAKKDDSLLALDGIAAAIKYWQQACEIPSLTDLLS